MEEKAKSQLRTNIETLMFGSKVDFKETKKDIKKLWHHENRKISIEKVRALTDSSSVLGEQAK